LLAHRETANGSVEACNYLLAVDVDMTVLDGFRYARWDKGYGDFECRPDLSTLRVVPWLEKTALVIGDLVSHDDAPIDVSPRAILRRQIGLAADQGDPVKAGPEPGVLLFQGLLGQAWRAGSAAGGSRKTSGYVDGVGAASAPQYPFGSERRSTPRACWRSPFSPNRLSRQRAAT